GRLWHRTMSLGWTLAEASNFYIDGDHTEATWKACQDKHQTFQEQFRQELAKVRKTKHTQQASRALDDYIDSENSIVCLP
ncbi:TPA: hypothetical protein ACH3X2_003171, partial [Trebouxia sp. C0005]